MVIFRVAAQRASVAVRLAAPFRFALVRLLVAVRQHVTVTETCFNINKMFDDSRGLVVCSCASRGGPVSRADGCLLYGIPGQTLVGSMHIIILNLYNLNLSILVPTCNSK